MMKSQKQLVRPHQPKTTRATNLSLHLQHNQARHPLHSPHHLLHQPRLFQQPHKYLLPLPQAVRQFQLPAPTIQAITRFSSILGQYPRMVCSLQSLPLLLRLLQARTPFSISTAVRRLQRHHQRPNNPRLEFTATAN